MVDFYPEFCNLSKKSIKNGKRIEQSVLERCKLALYASDWAAKTAIDNYRVDSSKIKVVPFGSNIDCKLTFEDVKNIINSRPKDRCRLLFLGKDWDRKGGEIALKVAKELNNQGLQAELNIIGCNPDIKVTTSNIIISHGFINKSSPEGLKKIIKLRAFNNKSGICTILNLPKNREKTAR